MELKKLGQNLLEVVKQKKEEITISGFLTTNAENNEKVDALNSTKLLVGFKCNDQTNPIPVPNDLIIKICKKI